MAVATAKTEGRHKVKIVACRPAWRQTSNRFTQLFSQAVQQSGWTVREFSWARLLSPNVILIHWPDELFTPAGWSGQIKAFCKLALLHATRALFGARIVWVVHETHPHDEGQKARWSTRSFISALDGTIFLSHASRRVSLADMPELASIPFIVTRHGHYRQDLRTPPQPWRRVKDRIELVYFGQIRPYKNLDGLINAAKRFNPEEMRIRIIGWSKDPAFTRELEALAADAPSISLDVRTKLVPQTDLEEAIRASDGVVLPYRKILNSGAALLALSCNRPVLAPRLGSLPELQSEIGRDWVSLYDGDISESALRAFGEALREEARSVADMTLYEWPLVGDAIGRFLDQLVAPHSAAGATTPSTGTERTWR